MVCGRNGFVAMKKILLASAFFSSLVVLAEVKEGENLIYNGRFEVDQTDRPLGWHPSPDTYVPKWLPTSGPDGLPAILFERTDEDTLEPSPSYRSSGFKLVPGGKYRLSAFIRTTGYRGKIWLNVINARWKKSAGIKNPKTKDGEWVKVEQEIDGFESTGNHGLIISPDGYTGRVEFADVKLVAINEKALKESVRSSGAAEAEDVVKMIPWAPLLHEIDEEDRTVTFRYLGKGEKIGGMDLIVEADGAARQVLPLKEKLNAVTLPEGAKKGVLRVALHDRAGQTNVWQEAYTFNVVKIPKRQSPRRRLNSFVSELVNEEVGAGRRRFSFTNDHVTWVAISVKGGDDVVVELDGKEVVRATDSRKETFRRVTLGEHVVDISGSAERLRVAQIPEILNYAPIGSVVDCNPRFDWAFQKKYVLPSVTTMNGGIPEKVAKDELGDFKSRGYVWTASMHSTKLKDGKDLDERLSKTAGMNEDVYEGVTCDEQHYGRNNDDYTKGLRSFDLRRSFDEEHTVYTWAIGAPSSPVLDMDFIAACVNASGGRGKLLGELYARGQRTENAARIYIRNYINERFHRLKEFYPTAVSNAGVILGNFTQWPILSLSHYPENDYKYFLDMQFNAMANDPAFEGIGCTGYWGSYYIDEEMLRWSFALTRHYCIQGKKEMLSEKYGFSFCPKHIVNADFDRDFEGWEASGDIVRDKVEGFGATCEGRWGGNGGKGDTFALLTRGGTANELRQRVKSLTPGKLYKLEFMVADYEDLKAGRKNPKRLGVEAALGECVERIDDKSWVFVNRRRKKVSVNLHHVVFRAKADSAELVITDAASPVGARMAVNAVTILPYFE